MSLPAAPSVLVVRLSSLGDVILVSPALESLKRRWPDARIAVLTRAAFADAFLGNPHVDEVLPFESRGFWGWAAEIRRRRLDAYVDLHDTPRSRAWGWFSGSPRRVRYDKRAWERRSLVWFKKPSPRLGGGVADRYMECLDGLGVPAGAARPRLYAPRAASLSRAWEDRLGPGPFLGVAPGALHGTKRWPADRFAAAADRLAARLSARVLVFGSAADAAAARDVVSHLKAPALNLAGETSLREMLLLTARCALFISNDSGAMHAAAALGVPTVAVFGPTVRAFGFFPPPEIAAVVETPALSCRPCSLHGAERCPLTHFRCMLDVSVERVVEAAERMLDVRGK